MSSLQCFSQNLVVSSLLCGSPGLGRMKSRPTPAPASAEGMTSIITSHENKIIFFTCKKLYINQCKSQLFCFCSQLPLLNFGSAGCLFDPHALETRTLQVQRQPFHLASTPSASLAGSESFVHINLRCIAICPLATRNTLSYGPFQVGEREVASDHSPRRESRRCPARWHLGRPWIAIIPTASKRLSATDPAIAQIALLAKITGWLDVAGGFNMFQHVSICFNLSKDLLASQGLEHDC